MRKKSSSLKYIEECDESLLASRILREVGRFAFVRAWLCYLPVSEELISYLNSIDPRPLRPDCPNRSTNIVFHLQQPYKESDLALIFDHGLLIAPNVLVFQLKSTGAHLAMKTIAANVLNHLLPGSVDGARPEICALCHVTALIGCEIMITILAAIHK